MAALDSSYAYFLVGKAIAQALTFGQASALPDMEPVFTCTDFSGYTGPPDWELPAYWQLPESYYGNDLWPLPAEDYGETGPTKYDLASIELTTKYQLPGGAWTSSMVLPPDQMTGRFLVGVKGPGQDTFTPMSFGAGVPPTLSEPIVGYAYSDTDGGQRVYVIAPNAPYFEALATAVVVYSAYDGAAPEPPSEFWTDFVGTREIV